MHTPDFWQVYLNHYNLITLLTVIILRTDQHSPELKLLTETLSKQFFNLDNYFYTVKVTEIFLNQSSVARTDFHYRAVASEVPVEKEAADDENQLRKVKRSTSDSPEGYAIIVWDVDSLREFLNKEQYRIVPKARAVYSILLAFTSESLCPSITNQIDYILRRFWVQYDVVNVIAQTLCSCDSGRLYIYRPFFKIRDRWGITQSYSLKDAVSKPGRIINNMNDVNQFPIPMSLFDKTPTAVKNAPRLLKTNPIYKNLGPSQGFTGMDGLLIGTIAESINCRVIGAFDAPGSAYGRKFPNGTLTGIMADVVAKRSLYGVNSRFLTDYGTEDIEFTVPYGSDSICAMVPTAEEVPRWQTLFRCFNQTVWVSVFCVFIICNIFWYFVKKSAFGKILWEMYSYLMGVPYKMVPSNSHFFFLGSCMMFNVVVMGIVQGSLFTDFTTGIYVPNIGTLEELDRSGLPIMTYIWTFINDESELIQSLKRKSIPFKLRQFQNGPLGKKAAILHRKFDMELLVKLNGTEGYMVPECLTTYLLVGIVPKGSPYLIVFNQIIIKLFESGLLVKWNKDVVYSLFMEQGGTLGTEEYVKAFSFQDLQAAFYIVGAGYVSSSLVFVLETLIKLKMKGNFIDRILK